VARRTLLASHPWKDLADPRLPEGTYRTSALSLAQLRSAGTTAGFDAAAVEAFWRQQGVTNEATLTLSLEAGVWTLFVAADGKSGVAVWTGDYTVTGDGTVELTEANVSGARATYHFRIAHDQLRFDSLAPECATERCGWPRCTRARRSYCSAEWLTPLINRAFRAELLRAVFRRQLGQALGLVK
jgi:hypothetical protein